MSDCAHVWRFLDWMLWTDGVYYALMECEHCHTSRLDKTQRMPES